MVSYVLGAGEQGSIMIPYIIEYKGFPENLLFFDDQKEGPRIAGGFNDLEKVLKRGDKLYLGIGNNEIRERVFEKFKDYLEFPNAIHPSAIIASGVKMGQGITIAPGVIINPLAEIGNACIINTGVILEHETIVKDYSDMEPTSKTMGGVYIGKGTTIGPGSVICEDIKIGDYSHIGAGSVVLKDIPNNSLAYGVPAKVIKEGKRYLWYQ